MGGQVFVLRSDLRELRCPVSLLPCDSSLDVSSTGFRGSPERERQVPSQQVQEHSKARKAHSLALFSVHASQGRRCARPRTDIGRTDGVSSAWYMPRVEAFVKATRFSSAVHATWRERPLPCLTLVGTGRRRKVRGKGVMARHILDTVQRLANTHCGDTGKTSPNAPSILLRLSPPATPFGSQRDRPPSETRPRDARFIGAPTRYEVWAICNPLPKSFPPADGTVSRDRLTLGRSKNTNSARPQYVTPM
jgi:hypothetical protein